MEEFDISNRLISRVEERELIMERIFEAPRELVFRAFSEPKHLVSWWGPRGWETTNYTFGFKPDGVWHYCMQCTDKNQGEFYGQKLWGKSIYHEIDVPEKIVYTDIFSDEKGNISDNMPGNLVTLTFLEYKRKTKFVMRYQLGSSQSPEEIRDSGFVHGLDSSFNRLDEFLNKENM